MLSTFYPESKLRFGGLVYMMKGVPTSVYSINHCFWLLSSCFFYVFALEEFIFITFSKAGSTAPPSTAEGPHPLPTSIRRRQPVNKHRQVCTAVVNFTATQIGPHVLVKRLYSSVVLHLQVQLHLILYCLVLPCKSLVFSVLVRSRNPALGFARFSKS